MIKKIIAIVTIISAITACASTSNVTLPVSNEEAAVVEYESAGGWRFFWRFFFAPPQAHFYSVADYECQSIKKKKALVVGSVRISNKYRQVPVPPNETLSLMSEFRNYSASNGVAISSWCAVGFSFVPKVGKVYAISHTQKSNHCKANIIDKETGRLPEGIQFHRIPKKECPH